jgi:hypothetical protein
MWGRLFGQGRVRVDWLRCLKASAVSRPIWNEPRLEKGLVMGAFIKGAAKKVPLIDYFERANATQLVARELSRVQLNRMHGGRFVPNE